METKLHPKEVELFGTLPHPYRDHNRAAPEKPHKVTILHRNTNLVKYRLHICTITAAGFVRNETLFQPNCTLVKLVLCSDSLFKDIPWNNLVPRVLSYPLRRANPGNEVALGTGRNNKQRPLSSRSFLGVIHPMMWTILDLVVCSM